MIAVNNMTVKAGDFSLHNLSFRLGAGKYGALMGRTGCGKTTLLEAIIGLQPLQSGTIEIAGSDVSQARPGVRGIGYVPQDGALFASMTVHEHLAFALEIRKRPKKQIKERVEELAAWLGIAHLLKRRPLGMSGGEVQRVALGRALSFHPSILLLDEPLSAVDEETRAELHELLRRVRQETSATVLHVTHNAQEARELADVVFILRDGAIQKENY